MSYYRRVWRPNISHSSDRYCHATAFIYYIERGFWPIRSHTKITTIYVYPISSSFLSSSSDTHNKNNKTILQFTHLQIIAAIIGHIIVAEKVNIFLFVCVLLSWYNFHDPNFSIVARCHWGLHLSTRMMFLSSSPRTRCTHGLERAALEMKEKWPKKSQRGPQGLCLLLFSIAISASVKFASRQFQNEI